jgi:hypothetical protein
VLRHLCARNAPRATGRPYGPRSLQPVAPLAADLSQELEWEPESRGSEGFGRLR